MSEFQTDENTKQAHVGSVLSVVSGLLCGQWPTHPHQPPACTTPDAVPPPDWKLREGRDSLLSIMCGQMLKNFFITEYKTL